MKNNFAHLHVHTTYSLLDGISHRKHLIDKAKHDGQTAISCTDHGSLYNHISFYKDCKAANIKPILGMEAYVAPDSRYNRHYDAKKDLEAGDISAYAYHLILLAKNLTGYHNLMKLSTLAWREGFYRKPRIDLEILNQYRDGLIVLSGCVGSMTSQAIIQGRKDLAQEYINKFRYMFGEDFYLELMSHDMPEDKIVSEALIDFGKSLGIGTVITNDSHFTNQEDSLSHEVALCLNTKRTMNDPDRWRFQGCGYWFKTQDEMRRLITEAQYPEESFLNAGRIADKIEDYAFKLGKHMVPLFRDVHGNQWDSASSHQKLVMASYDGLEKLGLSNDQRYVERLQKELDTMEAKEFSSYFLIISDAIEFIRRHPDMIPPFGRGSSVGSLVCYALAITAMDPIRWKVPFYRFINDGRKDLPDIDTDISQRHRLEVINYLVDKYGKDRVAQIITFQSMLAKKAIDDAGMALDIPPPVRRAVSKLVGDDVDKEDTIDDVLNPEARAIMEQHPQWIATAKALTGVHRNTSVHAAGIVISNDPIDQYVPLTKDHDGYLATQFDMKDVQDLGLLKLDMLGLRTLDVIHDAVKYIKQNYGIDINPHQIPYDDAATHKLVCKADFVSVFQYDSDGMRAMARALQPDNFELLMALNALYRPGPMKAEVILDKDGNEIGKGPSIADTYIERRHGRQKVDQWHPALEDILSDSYGLPIYQEQISEMSKIISGFNDTEADEYRAAIGKKNKEKFEAAQRKFMDRGVQNGHSREWMEWLAGRLAGFARYGWNRGHAAGYSRISYVTAYLEAHYPLEYYAALLNANVDKSDKLAILLNKIIQKGVEIKPPDINKSGAEFSTDGKSIYMGLYSVANVGIEALMSILWERENGGAFTSYCDFLYRISNQQMIKTSNKIFTHHKLPEWDFEKYPEIPELYKIKSANKTVIENLIKAGSFNFDDALTSKDKIAIIEDAQKIAKAKKKVDPSEFEFKVMAKTAEKRDGTEFTKIEQAKLERDVLNFFISGHPINTYAKYFGMIQADAQIVTPAQVQTLNEDAQCTVIGLLNKKEMKKTKYDKPYLVLRVQDQFGELSVRVWDPLSTQIWPSLQTGAIIVLRGVTERTDFRPDVLDVKVKNITVVSSGLPIRGIITDNIERAKMVTRALGLESNEPVNVPGYGVIANLKHAFNATPDLLDKLRGVDNFKLILVS